MAKFLRVLRGLRLARASVQSSPKTEYGNLTTKWLKLGPMGEKAFPLLHFIFFFFPTPSEFLIFLNAAY
jgi:hypothetical protein